MADPSKLDPGGISPWWVPVLVALGASLKYIAQAFSYMRPKSWNGKPNGVQYEILETRVTKLELVLQQISRDVVAMRDGLEDLAAKQRAERRARLELSEEQDSPGR